MEGLNSFDADVEDTISGFNDLNINTSKSRTYSPVRSGLNDLNSKKSKHRDYSPIPPTNTTYTMSPPPTLSQNRSMMLSPNLSLTYNLDTSKIGTGIKSDPFLVPVDLDYPERTPHSFQVHKVEEMQHDRFDKVTGYHIRYPADIMQWRLYEAELLQDVPRGFEGKIVKVKGPSVSVWTKHVRLYHKSKKLTCEQTKMAHDHFAKMCQKTLKGLFAIGY